MARAAQTSSEVEHKFTQVPVHVAIIMDGNGRWAEQQGLPRLEGHRAGADNLRRVADTLAHYGVKYLTLYTFSTENWGRPRGEIRGLFKILREVIDRDTQSMHQEGIRIRLLGTLDRVPKKLQQAIQRAIELTRDNTGMTVNFALNYGGRAEIINAISRIIAQGIPSKNINETLFRQFLYTYDIPDPDIIIRTGGDMRLSNFLLWQAAYSEFYFTPTFWPDFDKEEIERALTAYSQRQRKFGRLKPKKVSSRQSSCSGKES